MSATDKRGGKRGRFDKKVVELAAFRTGVDEPQVRVGTAADLPAAVALAEARHREGRLSVLPWDGAKATALFANGVRSADWLLLVAARHGEIVGTFLGMAAPYYFASGLLSTDLDFSIAPEFRSSSLATRLLRGYVAWAKELDVGIIQCGNATVFAGGELSRHFEAAGFLSVGDVLQYQGG